MRKRIIRPGDTFGRWTMVSEVRTGRWAARCACGTEAEVYSKNLTRGLSRSCGCLAAERSRARRLVHGEGHDKTPEYRCWAHIRNRCSNKNDRRFPDYGGRGIRVCERWDGPGGFANFLTDMGRRPSAAHSIDRYPDNDGDYEPGNCRWATRTQQARNTRTSRLITVDGVTRPMIEWAELTGVDVRLIHARIVRCGWDERDAVLTPSMGRSRVNAHYHSRAPRR